MSIRFPSTFSKTDTCGYEGNWHQNADLPLPVSTQDIFKNFINKLTAVEEVCYSELTGCKKHLCYICDKPNDVSTEYVLEPSTSTNWMEVRWPVGLMHYYTEHSVYPSQEFYQIIMSTSVKLNERSGRISHNDRKSQRIATRSQRNTDRKNKYTVSDY